MIRMSEQKDMSGDKTLSGGGFNINPVDIIMYLLSKWYWFVLSVSLFGGYAWYQYAKLPFIYSRSATVMIKDAYSNNIGRGLDRFNTYSYTNVSNEILQFQSHKLMCDVVNRLHANVCYLIMDDLREEELYTQAPVKVSFPEEEDHLDFSLTVRILNRKQVRLSDFSTDATSITLTANLGDTIQSPVGKIVVSPTLYYTDKWFNTPITIRRQSTDTMASLFRSNLNISQAENDASILYLSLRDYSTARAEDVLNMLITVYNEETIKDKNQIAINTSSFINVWSSSKKNWEAWKTNFSPTNRTMTSSISVQPLPCPCQTNGSTARPLRNWNYRHAWHATSRATWWTRPKKPSLSLQTPA